MATYNSMATPASGDGGLGLNVNTTGVSLGMEGFDTDMGFDESLLDDGAHGLSNLPFTPNYDFEPFSAFEDPFSYPSRPGFGLSAEAAMAAGASVAMGGPGGEGGGQVVGAGDSHRHTTDADAGFADPESSPQDELDTKLLSFSAPLVKATLLDENGQYVEPPGMTAELYGMFFVAEDVFGGETNPGSRPLELTCYRRNLWQCSGQITLPRSVAQVVLADHSGLQAPLGELAASITAVESIEGKPTEIISIPWKSSNLNNNGGGGDDHQHKAATAPPNVSLDLASGQELEGNRITLPLSWKRLQFKHATANNGRRKGLQQHYIVQISLLAKLRQPHGNSGGAGSGVGSDGFVKIAEIRSGPVIVRGRSPRNFDNRKDVPLTGDKRGERRSISNDLSAAASSVSAAVAASTPTAAPPKFEPGKGGDTKQNLQRYNPMGSVQQTAGDWSPSSQAYNSAGNQRHPSKKLALSPASGRPPVPAWSSSDSGKHHHQQQPPTPTKASASPLKRSTRGPSIGSLGAALMLPINLSLSEDERSPPNRSNSDSLSSPQLGKTGSTDAGGLNPSGSPLESADMLYEYFPLSVGDWMPPVDAIYRPHVVHHTIVPPEVKAQQVRTRAKRYFAAD